MATEFVTITEAEFRRVVYSAKLAAPELIQKARCLLAQWRYCENKDATCLVVRVYSSNFGEVCQGRSRFGMRVVVVDDRRNKRIWKAPLTHRTEGWENRLRKKIQDAFNACEKELAWRETVGWQERAYAAQERSIASQSVPTCFKCGAHMKLRTARKGKYKGNRFWGCSSFPGCDGIQKYKKDQTVRSPQEVQTVKVPPPIQLSAPCESFDELSEKRRQSAPWNI